MRKQFQRWLVGMIATACAATATADVSNSGNLEEVLGGIDILASTPVGSWARYEATEYDKKGRAKTVSSMLNKLLERESRDGVDHVWIEMEMQNFKIARNGERKPDGDRIVMKVLVEESFFSDSTGNFASLRGFGKEMIMQQGGDTPMRMRDVGGMAAGLTGMADINMTGDYERHGVEEIETPAGSFETIHISGMQETTVGMAMIKRTIKSSIELWLSDEVPFGSVKTAYTEQGRSAKRSEQLLVEYGMNGATSAITGTPEDLEMPGLKDFLPGR